MYANLYALPAQSARPSILYPYIYHMSNAYFNTISSTKASIVRSVTFFGDASTIVADVAAIIIIILP